MIGPDVVALPCPERIAASLAAHVVSVASLHEDSQNARVHNERNIKVISDSLRTFGQVRPILVTADGKIIAGNGTFRCAKAAGWANIAAVRFDSDDPALARAYGLVDNQSALSAEWSFTELANTLQELDTGAFDISAATGFDADELAKIAEWVPAKAPDDFQSYDENIPTEHQCPKCGYQWSGTSGPKTELGDGPVAST